MVNLISRKIDEDAREKGQSVSVASDEDGAIFFVIRHSRSESSTKALQRLVKPMEKFKGKPPKKMQTKFMNDWASQGLVADWYFEDIDGNKSKTVMLGDEELEFSSENCSKVFEMMPNLAEEVIEFAGTDDYYTPELTVKNSKTSSAGKQSKKA